MGANAQPPAARPSRPFWPLNHGSWRHDVGVVDELPVEACTPYIFVQIEGIVRRVFAGGLHVGAGAQRLAVGEVVLHRQPVPAAGAEADESRRCSSRSQCWRSRQCRWSAAPFAPKAEPGIGVFIMVRGKLNAPLSRSDQMLQTPLGQQVRVAVRSFLIQNCSRAAGVPVAIAGCLQRGLKERLRGERN